MCVPPRARSQMLRCRRLQPIRSARSTYMRRRKRHSLSARDCIAPSRFSPRLPPPGAIVHTHPDSFSIELATLFAQIVRRPGRGQSKLETRLRARRPARSCGLVFSFGSVAEKMREKRKMGKKRAVFFPEAAIARYQRRVRRS